MSIQRPALPQPIETILQDKKPCQRHTAFLEFYITFCAQVYSAAHVPVHMLYIQVLFISSIT